jgi:hypothetical protein
VAGVGDGAVANPGGGAVAEPGIGDSAGVAARRRVAAGRRPPLADGAPSAREIARAVAASAGTRAYGDGDAIGVVTPTAATTRSRGPLIWDAMARAS